MCDPEALRYDAVRVLRAASAPLCRNCCRFFVFTGRVKGGGGGPQVERLFGVSATVDVLQLKWRFSADLVLNGAFVWSLLPSTTGVYDRGVGWGCWGSILRFLQDAGGMRDTFGVAGFVVCRR